MALGLALAAVALVAFAVFDLAALGLGDALFFGAAAALLLLPLLLDLPLPVLDRLLGLLPARAAAAPVG